MSNQYVHCTIKESFLFFSDHSLPCKWGRAERTVLFSFLTVLVHKILKSQIFTQIFNVFLFISDNKLLSETLQLRIPSLKREKTCNLLSYICSLCVL